MIEMALAHPPTYQTPYRPGQQPHVFSPQFSPLAGFNFTVRDSITGVPISGVLCVIHAGPDGTGDADSVLTGATGKAGIDAIWFAPRSWSVSKEGYLNQTSNRMEVNIDVALVPTVIEYTVRIFSSRGGFTTPKGEITRIKPGFRLSVKATPLTGYAFSHWTYKGLEAGSQNPETFLIDRNAITIDAIFTDLPVPPPSNGNGNGNGQAPITQRIHVFNKVFLKATSYEFRKYLRASIIDIDTNLLISATVDYTVQYTDGSVGAEGAWIDLNDEEIVFESLKKGEAKTGSVDVTGKIREASTFTIKVESSLGNWSEVMYDVWLTLGFSEEPAKPPGIPPFDWQQWLADNALWLSIAGGAVLLGGTALILMRPQAPQIIVVGK